MSALYIESTMIYTQLTSFEGDEYHTAFAKNLKEEDRLIKADFEFVHYSEKDKVRCIGSGK